MGENARVAPMHVPGNVTPCADGYLQVLAVGFASPQCFKRLRCIGLQRVPSLLSLDVVGADVSYVGVVGHKMMHHRDILRADGVKRPADVGLDVGF